MRNFKIGVVLVLIYNLLSATKGVYLGTLLQTLNPLLLLFSSFSIVTLFFLSIELWENRGKRKEWGAQVKAGGADLLMVNLFSAAAWSTFFYAIKNLEPAVATAISNALIPLSTLALGLFLIPRSSPKVSELLASIGILGGVLFLIEVAYAGKSGIEVEGRNTILGLAMAILCGITMAINTFFSKRLNNRGWTARRILATRFYVLIALAVFMLPAAEWNHLAEPTTLVNILIISALGIIVPLYCFQVGVQKLDPMVVSLVLSTVPLISFVVQVFDQKIHFSGYSLAGLAVILGFSTLGVLARFNALSLGEKAH